MIGPVLRLLSVLGVVAGNAYDIHLERNLRFEPNYWTLSNAPNLTWTTMSCRPPTIVMSDIEGFVYGSNDNGMTWSQLVSRTPIQPNQWKHVLDYFCDGLDQSFQIPCENCTLFYDGQIEALSSGFNILSIWRDNMVFTSNSDGLFYFSIDEDYEVAHEVNAPANLSWTAVASEVASDFIYASAISTSGDHDNDGIYKSTDSGDSWTKTSAVNGDYSSLSVSEGGRVIHAAMRYGSLYKSSDYGSTWKVIVKSFHNWTVIESSCPDVSIAVSLDGYVYTTVNADTTWTRNDVPRLPWVDVTMSGPCDMLAIVSSDGSVYTAHQALHEAHDDDFATSTTGSLVVILVPFGAVTLGVLLYIFYRLRYARYPRITSVVVVPTDENQTVDVQTDPKTKDDASVKHLSLLQTLMSVAGAAAQRFSLVYGFVKFLVNVLLCLVLVTSWKHCNLPPHDVGESCTYTDASVLGDDGGSSPSCRTYNKCPGSVSHAHGASCYASYPNDCICSWWKSTKLIIIIVNVLHFALQVYYFRLTRKYDPQEMQVEAVVSYDWSKYVLSVDAYSGCATVLDMLIMILTPIYPATNKFVNCQSLSDFHDSSGFIANLIVSIALELGKVNITMANKLAVKKDFVGAFMCLLRLDWVYCYVVLMVMQAGYFLICLPITVSKEGYYLWYGSRSDQSITGKPQEVSPVEKQ